MGFGHPEAACFRLRGPQNAILRTLLLQETVDHNDRIGAESSLLQWLLSFMSIFSTETSHLFRLKKIALVCVSHCAE